MIHVLNSLLVYTVFIVNEVRGMLDTKPLLEVMLLYQWLHIMRRHQMEAFSALLALCAGNSQVTGDFPSQGPVTRSFDVFFDLYLNKRLSKQSICWWFETPSCSLWRHCSVMEQDGLEMLPKFACYLLYNMLLKWSCAVYRTWHAFEWHISIRLHQWTK